MKTTPQAPTTATRDLLTVTLYHKGALAVDAARTGPDAAKTFPFARPFLAELAQHRTLPTTASAAARLAFLESHGRGLMPRWHPCVKFCLILGN